MSDAKASWQSSEGQAFLTRGAPLSRASDGDAGNLDTLGGAEKADSGIS